MNIQIRNKHNKLSTAVIYGKLPVWKSLCRIVLPAFAIAMITALFYLVNYYLMVQFMPQTSNYSYLNIFIKNHHIFNSMIDNTKSNELINAIYSNDTTYESFIKYIALGNSLNFYNIADTIRIAISLIQPLLFLIGFVPILLGPGSNILFSSSISIKNRLREIKVWQNEFYTSLFITVGGILLIAILDYTVTPAMIKDALNENVGVSSIHNLWNNNYYYYNENGNIIFLKIDGNNYLNALTNEELTNINVTNINKFYLNDDIIANTFTQYYHIVGNNSIQWAEEYVIIYGAFLWIITIYYTYLNMIIDYGKTGLTTIIVFSITGLNMLLDWIFIKYADLGMNSSAVTTIITYFLAVIILILYAQYLYKKEVVLVSLWNLLPKNVMWDLPIIRDMLYICLSSIVKYICYLIMGILVVNQFAYVTGQLFPSLGSLYFISIMGAVLPIQNFFQNSVSNIMSVGTAMMAYNYGIKAFDRIIKIVYETSLFVAVYGFMVIGIVGYCTPVSDWFLSIFGINVHNNVSAEILHACARKFLIIVLAIVPIRGIGNNAYMLFRTTKRYISAIWVALVRSMIIAIIFLYSFSAVATHELIHIENPELAKINPIYNPNIWLVIWTQSSSMIASNLLIIIWIIYFMYIGIHKEKKSWQDYKIILALKKNYLNSLLKEKVKRN